MATCYRHPDRETGVACSNCGRPICPDCMTPTSVGMRCPECAKQKTKVKTGAAAFGRAGALYATYSLIALNVVGFLIEIGGSGGGLNPNGGQVLADYGLYGPAVANGDWYRVLTSGFMHANLLHLALNMYALYLLGGLLEPAFGRARFAAMYFASLLVASMGIVIFSHDTLTYGASGAVFGLFTAALVIAHGRRLEGIAAQLGFLLVINFVFTFTYPGVSIAGHVFGAAGGALCGLLILAGDREILGPNRVPVEVAVMALLGGAAAVASVVLA